MSQLSLFDTPSPEAPARAWPPAPWEPNDLGGWSARWPDGADAEIRPWEGGRWWWCAGVGQSDEAITVSSPRAAVAAVEAWLTETRAGIARGDWL